MGAKESLYLCHQEEENSPVRFEGETRGINQLVKDQLLGLGHGPKNRKSRAQPRGHLIDN
jgi:hypothetical protein